MKKVSISCYFSFRFFTTSNEPITISGKITNTENGQITIIGESFEKEIKLNADGLFRKVKY
jgi:hypothetical protein